MKETSGNIVAIKSKSFAIRCVKAYRYLVEEKHEYVLAKQMLKSGTSVGANVKEAIRGQSKPDFIAKMSIALKEASETEYWIELLEESGYFTQAESVSLHDDCVELIRILMSIIKSANEDLQKKKM